ncbi:50S ribosomal protein L25 [Rhynchospora pubera]|uniref:50S ribosomal protein L25 n=1 Tax=Rhynchospora pubera TaxID=906938 RepID=A0AAV8HZQ7_9POAL|nr:50S ribosomal protein L25 [Rhynchospora pubera]
MSILRRTHQPLLSLRHHLRYLSTATAAVSVPSDSPSHFFDPLQPLDYLPGFPRPDPKYNEKILAIPRTISGKNIAAKERKAGRVPAIVFEQKNGQQGGNKRLISVDAKQIRKLVDHLGRSFFLSRLFELEVWSEFAGSGELVEKVRVLPRLVHLHAGNDAPLNVTFLRAPSSALLKVDVPLVFRGEDTSPGLKKGSYFNTVKRTAKFLCPADIIPPYIDVDISGLDAGQKIVLGDLKVHPALKLLQSPEQPVCSMVGARAPEQKRSK